MDCSREDKDDEDSKKICSFHNDTNVFFLKFYLFRYGTLLSLSFFYGQFWMKRCRFKLEAAIVHDSLLWDERLNKSFGPADSQIVIICLGKHAIKTLIWT